MAQTDLQNWTLFLDRDGVINIEKENDYIYHWNEFLFYPNSFEAFKLLAKIFSLIVVVTNQKGVAKGKMSEDSLKNIHYQMKTAIEKQGGRMDGIYYSIDFEDDAPCRKPQIGMALQAKKKFPQIDFQKSMMVGNRLSDMQFGKNAGMQTVFLSTTHPDTPFPNPLIDFRFDNLYDFAKALMDRNDRKIVFEQS